MKDWRDWLLSLLTAGIAVAALAVPAMPQPLSLLAWAALWYGLAKICEIFDLQVYGLLHGALSGHTIKHVLAAGAVFAVVRQLQRRRALAAVNIAPAS